MTSLRPVRKNPCGSQSTWRGPYPHRQPGRTAFAPDLGRALLKLNQQGQSRAYPTGRVVFQACWRAVKTTEEEDLSCWHKHYGDDIEFGVHQDWSRDAGGDSSDSNTRAIPGKCKGVPEGPTAWTRFRYKCGLQTGVHGRSLHVGRARFANMPTFSQSWRK
jgi:hypothetical protein